MAKQLDLMPEPKPEPASADLNVSNMGRDAVLDYFAGIDQAKSGDDKSILVMLGRSKEDAVCVGIIRSIEDLDRLLSGAWIREKGDFTRVREAGIQMLGNPPVQRGDPERSRK